MLDRFTSSAAFLAAAATPPVPWFEQNAGTIITVGGSVIVAVVAGAFALWAKHHTPRQPVPIQDVWSENRSLRADLIGVEGRLDDLDRLHRTALDAISILWRYVERIKGAWGIQAAMPVLSPAERRTLSAVITDADTPTSPTPTGA